MLLDKPGYKTSNLSNLSHINSMTYVHMYVWQQIIVTLTTTHMNFLHEYEYTHIRMYLFVLVITHHLTIVIV